jgi:hypothetical protein
VLGSPLYMSPEQAMGSSIDGRTDVFAFGAILFEATCGYRAYDAPNFNALIVTIATTQPRSIDEGAPKVPESLRAVIRDCMVTDRDKRLASFDEIADRLLGTLPELEKASIRLPTPACIVGEPLSDPDATNALPVVRPRDRPAGMSSASGIQVPRSGNGPPGGYSAPWATPPGSNPASTENTASRRPAKFTYLLGAATVALAVALVAAVAVRARGDAPRSLAAAVPQENAQAPKPAAPVASASGSVPVISIDSLPVSTKPSAAPDHGSGRLMIGASPGWCTVSVDGVKQGPTPLPALDLAAGLHQLRCESPSGRAKTATITIQDGATARYKFSVE